MKPTVIGAACALALLAFGAAAPDASAQDSNQGRNLSAACFTCHGTDGRSAGGIPPSLAGQKKDYLFQQLKDFKSGKRPATIMHQQAKGYTDTELEAISAYFAGVPAAPSSSRTQGSY